MKEWSKYFQNPNFLERSRMMLMNPDLKKYVVDKVGIKSGMSVLDIGCGMGHLMFYIADVIDNVSFSGIDNDKTFISKVKEKAINYKNANNSTNTFDFKEADAYNLSFADNTFDIVMSQTVLTSLPDYNKALIEMKRVCKNGGKVFSITPMTFYGQTYEAGDYPDTCTWKKRYDELFQKVNLMYSNITPLSEYTCGVVPRKIPRAFFDAGLRDISVYPLGRFLSLSNATMSKEDKIRYINLDYLSELEKFSIFCDEKLTEKFMTKEEEVEYKKMLLERKEYLLSSIGENEIWEWLGDANLLVVGTKKI